MISLGLTWSHLVSHGLTWSHLVSFGLTWFQMVSLGFIWSHLVSLAFTWSHLVSLGLTWFHLVSLGLTWSHFDFTFVSLWFNFGLTSILLWSHVYLTLISLWFHIDFMLIRRESLVHEGKGKAYDKREKGKAGGVKGKRERHRPGIWSGIRLGNQTARTHARHETISRSGGACLKANSLPPTSDLSNFY